MTPILEAIQLRHWYAAAALALTLIIQFVRKAPVLQAAWQKVPQGWRWTLPVVSGAAVAFVTAFEGGQSFPDALVAMVGGALGIGIGAMGIAAMLKESIVPWDGGKGGKPTQPKPSTRVEPPTATALLMLVALLACVPVGFTGCASAGPAIAAAVPAIFNALGTAGAAIHTIEAWVDRFEGAPGVTPETVADIRELLEQARVLFGKASETAQLGGDSLTEAQATYAEARKLLTQALGFLGTLGLYDGARLIPPEQGRASLPGESLRLDLPPEEL